MTQEQFRLDVQAAVRSYVQQFMRQNQVPAAMMEDAINAALLDVKTMVYMQLVAANQLEAESQKNEEEEDGEQHE